MSMATTALLRLAPLPPHARPLAPTSSNPALLAPLGSGRRAAGALRLARAAGDGLADQTVYNGVYGPWSVDDADVREVLLYRAGLVTAAASFLVAASGAFLPEGNAVGDAVRQGADLFYAAGAGGLGLSLVLIHIYVTPIKRFLQALWAVGTYALAARPLDEGLVRYGARAPRGDVVRRADLRRAHRPRLQGRSLLWKIGSWYLDVCYPHPSSRTPVWFDGRRDKNEPLRSVDGALHRVCREEIPAAHQGRHRRQVGFHLQRPPRRGKEGSAAEARGANRAEVQLAGTRDSVNT